MKQPLNEQFIRMQKLAGIINENKVNFQPHLNEGSDTYPFKATPEVIALYDKIANELEGTISMVANKLEIPESDIRICLDYLYDDLQGNKAKKRGMFIQVKTDDAKWDEAWTGNPLIMQTTNDEGIVIPSNPFFGVSIKGNKNPKVRAIYNKALDLDLEALAASENTKIADLVSPEEMKLIAPNTPIVVTGKSNLNEEKFYSRNYIKQKYKAKAKKIEDNIEDEMDNNPNIWDLYTSLETPKEVDNFIKGFIN